ncbi:hypothetical protein [Bradyrhizobium japonicum]|uniref:hypothetical protein n=1 Tax=Bradyrhizobium japonicum TaxID=375 RepID=UPI0011813514|nr:hypothetical protein [Bradyrhizobium japonicum]
MSYFDYDPQRPSRGAGVPPSLDTQIEAGLRFHMQRSARAEHRRVEFLWVEFHWLRRDRRRMVCAERWLNANVTGATGRRE